MKNKIYYKQLITGIKKSEENASELIEDANILLENNRFARSFTLFQLAIEEIGKCALITSYIIENDNSKLGKLLKELSKHKIKTDYSISYDMMLYKYLNDKDKKTLLEAFYHSSTNLELVDNFKNYSLYTSIIQTEFKKPSEIITKAQVETHKFWAETRLKTAKFYNKVFIDNFPEIIQARKEIDFDDFVKKFIDEEKEIIYKAAGDIKI